MRHFCQDQDQDLRIFQHQDQDFVVKTKLDFLFQAQD